MQNLLIFTECHEASRIKALEAYNGAKNDIFVYGFVHGKFLDSGEISWISLERGMAMKPLVRRIIGLYWISLKVEWLRGLDLNQRPLGYEPNKLPGCSTPRQNHKLSQVKAQVVSLL